MKAYMKIVLLVALALLLTLTACNRQASKTVVPTATTNGELPFPVGTAGTPIASDFSTQTAVASLPMPSATPQVITATDTPTTPDQGQGGTAPEPQATAAPDTNVPMANTPVVSRPTTYTLQRGEWPLCIARRYNLDVASFLSANGMTMNSKPAEGAQMTIPASGSWSAAYGAQNLVKHPATYTVSAGDTLNTIACRYGDVAPESILVVNNLQSASDVKAGMALKIP